MAGCPLETAWHGAHIGGWKENGQATRAAEEGNGVVLFHHHVGEYITLTCLMLQTAWGLGRDFPARSKGLQFGRM